MEIRYVAYPGTPNEKSFLSEEECRNFEKEQWQMWTSYGEETNNPDNAIFVYIPNEATYLFDAFKESKFPGIYPDDFGFFYWNFIEEEYDYYDEPNFQHLINFLNSHPEVRKAAYAKF